MWAQEKGQPSPGWHSWYRRPAGQPASEAAPESVPSSGPAALAASCAHPTACLYSPRCPPPDRPTTPSRACPPGPVPRPLLRSPHTSAQPESASFLLHLPITGLGKGQPVGMGWERSKGTCESGSKGKVGISSVGVSRAEPGLGLTSADLGAADAALDGGPGAGRPGAALRAQLLPSSTRNTAVLPGTPGAPQPGPRAVGHLPALQDARHTGAGDKEGGFRRQSPAHFPEGPTARLAAHPLPGSPSWLTSCHAVQSPPPRAPGSPRS